MKWIGLPENFNYEEYAGFVYLITNLITNRKYIGRKYFSSTTRKKVEGRKNRKITIKESDWKSYNSSCKDLKEDIEFLGIDNFSFRILSVHKTKGETNYEEVAQQFKRDVLKSVLSCGTREYYNSNILSRYFIPKPEGSPEAIAKRAKQSETLKNRLKSGEIVHPMKGKVHPNKGKKLPQTGHNKNRGSMYITNGIINKKININGVVPENYYFGKTQTMNDNKAISLRVQKNRISYNENPNLCQVCKTVIPFEVKINKTCSYKCLLVIQRKILNTIRCKINRKNYHTPKGVFNSLDAAGSVFKVTGATISNWCKDVRKSEFFVETQPINPNS